MGDAPKVGPAAAIGRSDRGFPEALAEAERAAATACEDCSRPRRPEAPACIGFGSAEGAAVTLWAAAAEWTDEPTQPTVRQASFPTLEPEPSGSDLASIARELGLGAGLTPSQLASRRRDFIWRNHPDRHPEHARARAGERVALANALHDAARRTLAETR